MKRFFTTQKFKQVKTGTPYHYIGLIGFLLGVSLNFILAYHFNLSLWTVLGYSSLTVIAFYSYAMIAKIIKGYEDIVYYRHEIVMLTVTACYLNLTGKPVVIYLDLYVLGLSTFLVFGRLGCFFSGCCFGRPHRYGMKLNIQRGYPSYLSGITIFPTQLIESGIALLITLFGVAILWNEHQPGEALAWYTITYGAARFVLEYFRGDKRPYLLGLSEAQWTTLILVFLLLLAGNREVFIVESWQYYTAALLFCMAILTIAFRFAFPDLYRLFHPHHIRELLRVIKNIRIQDNKQSKNALQDSSSLSDIKTYTTSAGLILSGGPVPGSDSHNISLSGATQPITEFQAKRVFELILRLQGNRDESYEIHGRNGIYHMLLKGDVVT